MTDGAPAPGRRTREDAVRAERERIWAGGGLPEAGAWHVMSLLLTAVLVFGGGGWLLGRWLGWPWLAPIGLAVGMAAAVTDVWFRYGVDRSAGAVTSTSAGLALPPARRENDRPTDPGPLEDLL